MFNRQKSTEYEHIINSRQNIDFLELRKNKTEKNVKKDKKTSKREKNVKKGTKNLRKISNWFHELFRKEKLRVSKIRSI